MTCVSSLTSRSKGGNCNNAFRGRVNEPFLTACLRSIFGHLTGVLIELRVSPKFGVSSVPCIVSITSFCDAEFTMSLQNGCSDSEHLFADHLSLPTIHVYRLFVFLILYRICIMILQYRPGEGIPFLGTCCTFQNFDICISLEIFPP